MGIGKRRKCARGNGEDQEKVKQRRKRWENGDVKMNKNKRNVKIRKRR